MPRTAARARSAAPVGAENGLSHPLMVARRFQAHGGRCVAFHVRTSITHGKPTRNSILIRNICETEEPR